MKISTSQAFAESMKQTFPRRKFENFSPVKRPSSQLNSRASTTKQCTVKCPNEEHNEAFVEKLLEENKWLKAELDSMRKINRTLLETEQISSEQFKVFYQNVVFNHMQQKIEKIGEEASFYRFEHKKNLVELDNLKKDKKYIQSIAHRYKVLNEGKSGRASPVKNSTPLSEKLRSQSSDLYQKVIDLQEFLSGLHENLKFSQVLSKFAEFTKFSLGAEKVSMILLTEELQEMYTKSYKNTFKHYWNNLKVILAEGPNLSSIELENLEVDQIKAGFTSGKDLYSTVHLNSTASIYICLHSKTQTKKSSQLFTASDYKYFSLLSSCFSLFLNYYRSRARELIEIDHVSNLSSLVSKLVCNKNHKELANSIFKQIPKFLEFEVAGIIFADLNEFFMMIPNSGPTEKFSDVSVRFPMNHGITGDVFKKNTVIGIENIRSHRLFNPEIDNSCRIGNLENAIFASVIGKDNEVVGVLQVFNKTSGKIIAENDLEKMRNLQRIVGICVSSTNCICEAASLTINFRQSVQDIMRSMEFVDREKAGADFLDVKNALNNMKSNVTEWSNQKKQNRYGSFNVE